MNKPQEAAMKTLITCQKCGGSEIQQHVEGYIDVNKSKDNHYWIDISYDNHYLCCDCNERIEIVETELEEEIASDE